jgi:hypothetical protein
MPNKVLAHLRASEDEEIFRIEGIAPRITFSPVFVP